MHCNERERQIIAYAAGELGTGEATDCQAHIESCARCRSAYESYARIAIAMAREPELLPTARESEALVRALARTYPAARKAKAVQDPLPGNLPVLIWASLLAFLAVASLLALQTLGRIDIAAALRAVGPAPIALGVAIFYILTSLLPIAVMARRRPLNGMTFRR